MTSGLDPLRYEDMSDMIMRQLQQLDASVSSPLLISSYLQDHARTRTWYGNRAFSVIAPTLWNNLPTHICVASSLDSFKSLLKAHLFTQSQ